MRFLEQIENAMPRCYGARVRPSVASWLPDCFRDPEPRHGKSGTDHVFHAASEISTRFRSGSRTYTERSFDTAPVLATGPSMIFTCKRFSREMTSSKGTAAMKQRSSDPGTAT